jgi:hypothetical protein
VYRAAMRIVLCHEALSPSRIPTETSTLHCKVCNQTDDRRVLWRSTALWRFTRSMAHVNDSDLTAFYFFQSES